MIDLTTKTLPNTLRVAGRDYSIYTDFRVWIRFFNELHSGALKDLSYLFKNECPVYVRPEELRVFAAPKNSLPRKTYGTDDGAVVIDYEIDGDLIVAAFWQQYGIDLTTVDMHWHIFLALLHGLTGTKLDTVMSYRAYRKDSRKNVDHYEEMKNAWRIDRITPEEQVMLDDFNAAFQGDN